MCPPPKVVGMSPGTRASSDEELARARLALISAGLPALGAPRRAADDAGEETRGVGIHPDCDDVPDGGADDPSRVRFFDRFSVTTRQAVAVLALLLCGVVVALTALGRSSASQLPTDPTPLVSVSAAHSSPVPSRSARVLVRVHVLGAVVSPGVVIVTSGAIVQDAVLAAGGLRADADPAELNLAAPVSDGQQVIVGTTAAPRGQVNTQPRATSADMPGGLVNLNTATQVELEGLPGVGPVLAGAIVAWRQENGGFGSVAELQEVSGIGPKSYAKLEPLVTA